MTVSNEVSWRRLQELRLIAGNIRAGESTSVVGVSGVGKSNLLRTLASPSFLRKIFEDDCLTYLPVMLDGNALPLSSDALENHRPEGSEARRDLARDSLEHSIFGLILGHISALEHLPDAKYDWQQFRGGGTDLFGPDEILDLLVVPALSRLLSDDGTRIAIIIDQFDEPFKAWPGRFLTKLRALRDRFKYRMCYVLGTRDDLPKLRPDFASYEEFHELVAPNVCWIKPFSPDDASDAVRELVSRRGWNLEEAVLRNLLDLCGGHAGLLRSSAAALGNLSTVPQDVATLEVLLGNDSDVERESEKLWNSLPIDEQESLTYHTTRGALAADQDQLRSLTQKGVLMKSSGAGVRLFSPLFARFIQSIAPKVSLNSATRTIAISGVSHSLTKLEFLLTQCMLRQPGVVCSRDEIASHVYGEGAGGDIDNSRIDALVERLRKKIEADPHEPELLLTVRGQGYRLVLPSSD